MKWAKNLRPKHEPDAHGERATAAVLRAAKKFGRDFTAAELIAAVGPRIRPVPAVNALHRLLETAQVDRVTVGCGKWQYRLVRAERPKAHKKHKGVIRCRGRQKFI